ncbi:MAG: phosphatase PAP2 family protein [Rhodothermales bacterium]
MKRRRSEFRWAVFVLWLFVLPLDGRAQSSPPSNDPYRFIEWSIQDVKAIARGVPSKYSLYAAAGMGGALLTLSWQDDNLTDGAIDLAEGTNSKVRRVVNEIGNVKAVRPMALLLFLGSLTSSSRRFQDAAFTSLEAVVFSNLLTNTLKSVVGRARPYQDRGAQTFRPLSGDKSFPSGHATTVFAFTTPWLLYYSNVPTYGLFILGIGTAFMRMADNAHWFTDVLVGGGIGFTTAYMLTRRHQRRAGTISVTPVLADGQGGLFVRVRL